MKLNDELKNQSERLFSTSKRYDIKKLLMIHSTVFSFGHYVQSWALSLRIRVFQLVSLKDFIQSAPQKQAMIKYESHQALDTLKLPLIRHGWGLRKQTQQQTLKRFVYSR